MSQSMSSKNQLSADAIAFNFPKRDCAMHNKFIRIHSLFVMRDESAAEYMV